MENALPTAAQHPPGAPWERWNSKQEQDLPGLPPLRAGRGLRRTGFKVQKELGFPIKIGNFLEQVCQDWALIAALLHHNPAHPHSSPPLLTTPIPMENRELFPQPLCLSVPQKSPDLWGHCSGSVPLWGLSVAASGLGVPHFGSSGTQGNLHGLFPDPHTFIQSFIPT